MASQRGKLYGVGVGPGDPDLVTVKALNVLRKVDHIFAACSSKNQHSIAHGIISKHLPDAVIEHLPFPMTRDEQALTKAWEDNARRAMEVLDRGKSAAFVTLGDPMTYSTFTYLLRTVRQMACDVPVVLVPGITSYQAAAAALFVPLAEGEESVQVISGARGSGTLRRVIETAENVVILKVYREFNDIFQCLEELNLVDCTFCVSRTGLTDEMTVKDLRSLKGKELPYLSLLIVKRTRSFP